MNLWLMHQDTLRELRERRAALGPADPAREGQFLEEQRAAAAARKLPRGLSVAGNVAELRVDGILVENLSFWLWLLGYEQTAYADLQAGIEEAIANPDVTSVRFLVNSVGGSAAGLFETFAAIERLREVKDVSVRANNAFSAAYGIAAVAGPITAQTVASMFGSVGVAVSYFVEDDVVDITNSDSPDKRPDVTTEEGRAVVVRELDAVYELFADAIARGRKTTVEDVRKNFGRGASFVAAEAKRRGMIDNAPGQLRAVSSTTAAAGVETTSVARGGAKKENPMNLQELRAQHPELYEAVVQVGVTQERDRVCAHLELGVQSGALETAYGAIRDGAEMTQTLTAKYLAAGMNRADQRTRQAESDAAGKTVENAAAPEGDSADLTDRVADAMFGSKKGK